MRNHSSTNYHSLLYSIFPLYLLFLVVLCFRASIAKACAFAGSVDSSADLPAQRLLRSLPLSFLLFDRSLFIRFEADNSTTYIHTSTTVLFQPSTRYPDSLQSVPLSGFECSFNVEPPSSLSVHAGFPCPQPPLLPRE